MAALDRRMSRTYDIDVGMGSTHNTRSVGSSPLDPRPTPAAGAKPQPGSAAVPELSGRPRAATERLAYTVEEAADVVGVGRDLLYDEIRTGRLRSKKAGARRVVARHHLVEWLDSDWPESSRRAS
jgi:excisionase family DNA binding protein